MEAAPPAAPAELGGLGLPALQAQAEREGVPVKRINEALDSPDPASALVALVQRQRQAGPAEEGTPLMRTPPPEGTPPPGRAAARGYLALVAAKPSPAATWLPQDPPPLPTPLEAAQRRLAFAALCHERLPGVDLIRDMDVAGLVGRLVKGLDHFLEREKRELYGADAAAARDAVRGDGGLVQFEVEGCVNTEHNGAYALAGEHLGWPHFRNEKGHRLYRFLRTNTWRLGPTFSPETDSCNAHVEVRSGELPLGERSWQYYMGSGNWAPRPLTMVQAAVTPDAAAAREEAMLEALVRQAAVARSQLRGVVGVSVDGCPQADCNGAFLRLADEESGEEFMRFMNAKGCHLYRYAKTMSWRLGPTYSPKVDSSFAYIIAKDGKLPLGVSRVWQCHSAGVWSGGEISMSAISEMTGALVKVRQAQERREEEAREQAREACAQLAAADSIAVEGCSKSEANGAYVQVAIHPLDSGRFELTLQGESLGDSTTVSVDADMQVYEVKELVQKEKGEPVEYLDALRLLRDTVPLEDGRTLSSYGVRAGETLLLSSQDPEIGRAERRARGERALQVSQQAAGSAAVRDAPEGWPHLRNAHGCHLYRYQKTESWRLGPTFSPVTDSCNAVRW